MNKYESLEISPLEGIEPNRVLIYINGRAFKTDERTGMVARMLRDGAGSAPAVGQIPDLDAEQFECSRKTVDSIIARSEQKKPWNRRLHLIVFKFKISKKNMAVRMGAFLFRRRIAPVLCALSLVAFAVWIVEAAHSGLLAQFPSRLLPLIDHRYLLFSYPLVVVFMLTHELGHASALRHYGEVPSEIGGGLFFLTPTLFCNVNAAWKLKRFQRAVVSLGGVYFELILALVALPLYFFLRSASPSLTPFLLIFILFEYSGVLANLYPTLYRDGHWLAIDFFGIQSNAQTLRAIIAKLRGSNGPNLLDRLSKPMAFLLCCYSLFSYGFLALMGIIMLRFAGVFVGQRLPELVPNLFALRWPQYVELFWGSLLTVSVAVMAIRLVSPLWKKHGKKGNRT